MDSPKFPQNSTSNQGEFLRAKNKTTMLSPPNQNSDSGFQYLRVEDKSKEATYTPKYSSKRKDQVENNQSSFSTKNAMEE